MQQCSNFGVDLDRNKNEKFLIFIKKHYEVSTKK